MPASTIFRRPPRALLATALLAAAGCTPPVAPETGPRTRPIPEETAAALLALEDQRLHDATVLAPLAGDADAATRGRTALALGRIRGDGALPLLLDLLADPDTAVAATAAFSLGQLGDTAAVPALEARVAPAAARTSPAVAGEAAAALGKLRRPSSRPVLATLLATSDLGGDAARQALGPALLAIWKLPRDPDLAPILRWTTAADPEMRWRAVYALVRRPEPSAFRALTALASDPDPRVRALIARGLSRPAADSAGVGTDEPIALLLAALDDADYAVRINAARSLASYTDVRAVDALASAAGSPHPHLALTALEGLGRQGRSASGVAAQLRSQALDPQRPLALRAASLEALARVTPVEAVSVAAGLAAHPAWRLRVAAARALAAASPGASAPELDRVLADRDPRVVGGALDAVIGAAGDSLDRIRRVLVGALGHPDPVVRAGAIGAIGAIGRSGDATALPLLLDAYERARADTANDAAVAAVDAVAALRRAGVPGSRAFFARFPRSTDPVVRARAEELFGDTAVSSWGAARPVETGLGPADYRRIAREWVLPAASGTLPRARIDTERGSIELELFAGEAPLTVRNFLHLAERGYFDGQEWPRVVPNFVVQGGDPRGDTSGGPGYVIRDELNRHLYLRGTLGMALSGPDTGGSQFFVTHSEQPHLDGSYTVFGRVVSGMEVAEQLLPGERILSVRRIR